jgi:hypothetical protein
MNKKLGLGIAMLLAVVLTACGQTSLSGRYVSARIMSVREWNEWVKNQ